MATAALTPHDLWHGVATRARGMAADYGPTFDQVRLGQSRLSQPAD